MLFSSPSYISQGFDIMLDMSHPKKEQNIKDIEYLGKQVNVPCAYLTKHAMENGVGKV
jgi:hypothetical protein